VATRLSAIRVTVSETLSWPAYVMSAIIIPQRNTTTGKPNNSLASRSNTSPAHLLLP
jgi:hypothetical protein